ncbi:hypothetical protein MMC26_006676 [Xylographa opegraphella]|nr:hypothetical protein [Xylographa opegraphella]
MLPRQNIEDNNKGNDIHTIKHEQQIPASAESRPSMEALFTRLYPGYTADSHAYNSFHSPNQDLLKTVLGRPPIPPPERVDWPSPTVSEFLRVASPSTSWIDIDEDSNGQSSTSESQEEVLPEVPHLVLGSPLVPRGSFNVNVGSAVVKSPFCHRIPERAPSFENLECNWCPPDPRGNYLRTLDSKGHVTFIPFSPVSKIQYAESETLTSEELVALNGESPLVLRARRVKARRYQKLLQRTAEPQYNVLHALEAVRSCCNAADITLAPPDLPELTRSQLGANLTRLRSRVVRLRSDMADKQLHSANNPGNHASEQDDITHTTAPLDGHGSGNPSVQQENATVGPISGSAVRRSRDIGLIKADRQHDATGVDESLGISSLFQLPGYDQDNGELENVSIDAMTHPGQNGSTEANDRDDRINSIEDVHVGNVTKSPEGDLKSIGTGSASIDTAGHACRIESTPKNDYDDVMIVNGIFQDEWLPQFPSLNSDTIELGRADIGRVYRPRSVELTSKDHRRQGIVFEQDPQVETLSQSSVKKHRNSEPFNATVYDESTAAWGTERRWTDYMFDGKSSGAKSPDLVVTPASGSRKLKVANFNKHNDIQPLQSEPKNRTLSEISTGTVVVHRLRRRRGMIFDASMDIEPRNVSSGTFTALWNVPIHSPADVIRKARIHELTLAILEGRVKSEDFKSLMGWIETSQIDCDNDSRVPMADPRFEGVDVPCAPDGSLTASPEHLCGMGRRARSALIETGVHGFQARRRVGGQWLDQYPRRASAIPLANGYPRDTSEAQTFDEPMPGISTHSSSKVHRSPKAWLRDKVKRITRIFR